MCSESVALGFVYFLVFAMTLPLCWFFSNLSFVLRILGLQHFSVNLFAYSLSLALRLSSSDILIFGVLAKFASVSAFGVIITSTFSETMLSLAIISATFVVFGISLLSLSLATFLLLIPAAQSVMSLGIFVFIIFATLSFMV